MNNMDMLLPKEFDRDRLRWATVTDDSPLTIRLDGETGTLLGIPDTLVYGLAVGERVLVVLIINDDPRFKARRAIILGKAGGVIPATPPPAGLVKLDERILAGTAATVTLPQAGTIAGSYSSLQIHVVARADTASVAFTGGGIQFNGDTGANYDSEQVTGSASTPAAFESLNGTSASIGEVTASTAVAGSCSTHIIVIPNYAGTTFWKPITVQHMLQAQTSGGQAGQLHSKHWVGRWRNTAAITSVVIRPGSGNFIAGSRFTLYALP